MSKRKRHADTAESPIDPVGVLVRVLVPALLVARLLIPAEASVLGDTLALVLLWFAAAVLWAWNCFRAGTFALRVGWLDAALWLLIAGHAISTGSVFAIGGDRRAAVNVLWEWVALGVSFFLIRQTLLTRADARRLLLVMSAAAVALAGLGIWQHYVTFPDNVTRYERLRELEERSPSSSELRQIRAEMDVPQTPASRVLWEERLRSSEPFATMALANTLAGLLAAWLIVIVAAGVPAPSGGWSSRTGPVIAALLVAFCLVLTKSRTAAFGACAGVLTWAGLSLRRARPGRKWIVAALATIAVAGVLIAVALWTGGLDRQVFSESPKSLRYRLQYWAGTTAVLLERPVLGTGPGNFRQHYLRHKLPESSEEVLDPHNFLLDVWTSAGLVGTLALVWLLVVAARMYARAAEPAGAPEAADRPGVWTPVTVGGALGFAIVLTSQAILGGVNTQLIGVAAAWIVAVFVLQRTFLAGEIAASATAAAAVALLVHLLGAGGIEMPAVAQTLLLLLAAGSILASPGPNRIAARRWIAAAGLAGAGFFVLGLLTAAAPVLQRQSLVAAGDLAISENRNLRQAERLYAEAAEQDPWSPEPAERLAELAFSRWARATEPAPAEFERAADHALEVVRRDPFSANGFRRLGVWYLERHRRTGRDEAAREAVHYLTEAAQRYPHFAPLRAELARALSAAEARPEARKEAEFALELDAINRREGHRDKYLPEDTLDALRQIAGILSSAAD